MLEILAGPYDIVDMNGDAVTDIVYIDRSRHYDDEIGLILRAGVSPDKWVVQLDGTACLRGGISGAVLPDLKRSGEISPLLIVASSNLYTLNKKSLTEDELLLSSVDGNTIHVRLKDRFLYASSSQIKYRPLDLSSSLALEATLTGVGSLLAPKWSRTRSPDVLALAYPNGDIAFYNHVTKTQVPGVSFIGTNSDAWYSQKFDVWVRLTNSGQIYIHASRPRPSAISNPSGTAPSRGRITTYSVTVTGDAGEPCAGELIDWSLGGGSLGQLSATQSMTDDDGIATIDYLAPVIGSLGDVTVNAEIKF